MGSGTSDWRSEATSSETLDAVADKASATGHNAADVMFAQMMTPHHSQAIDMAKLATTRAGSPEVKALATKLEAAQQPEIDKMNGWLQDWSPSAGNPKGGGMSGMMSERDMASLEATSGAVFDKTFLQMMVQHHTGAIEMATSELQSGKNAEALALATSIQVTQQAEVNQMNALLE